MGNWNEFGGWGMGFGFLFMLLFWTLIILGIVAAIRWLMRELQARPEQGGRPLPHDKTPLEIVQERYARGEIGREEYEQKKLDLET